MAERERRGEVKGSIGVLIAMTDVLTSALPKAPAFSALLAKRLD
jgi:hypothetical protein